MPDWFELYGTQFLMIGRFTLHSNLNDQFVVLNNAHNSDFSSGFKEYLQTAPNYDFPSYRHLVHNITQTFNNISNEVIDIEKKLRDSGKGSIGDLVRKIQLKEKEKLEMVSLKCCCYSA